MILFSTLQQGWSVWLFCYLGFLSGIIFFASYSLATYLNNHPHSQPNKASIQKNNKDNRKDVNKGINNDKNQDKNDKKNIKNNKKQANNRYYDKKNNQKDKKRKNKKKNYKILFKKLHTFCLLLWKFVVKFSTEIILISTLCGVIVVSLLVNLHFNYGILSPPYIALWLGGFVISKYFLKSLANIFLSIYNKFKNKKVVAKYLKNKL